jgi:hypothetical protein
VGASAVAQDLTAATQPIFAPRTEAIAKKHFRVSAAAFSDATSGTLDEIRKAVRKFKFTTPDGVRLPAREEQQLAQAIHNTRMAGDLNKLFELYETAVATRKLRSEVAGVGTLEFADSPAGPASIPKGFVQVPGVPSTRQDLTVYAEEASTVRGKRVRVKGLKDATTLKPGTVYVVPGFAGVRLTAGQKENWQTLQKTLRALVRRFAPDTKIVLQLGNKLEWVNDTNETGGLIERPVASFDKDAAKSFGGTMLGVRDRVGLMVINPSELLTPATAAKVLAHEFGHLLVWRHFGKASPATQEKVLRAFDRARLANEQRQGATTGFSPAFASFALEDLAGGTPRSQMTGEASQGVNYFYSLDEFLAEQTVLWMNSNAEALSVIQKFFKDIANVFTKAIRSLAERFGVSFTEVNLQPEPAVADWLDSVAARSTFEGARPLSQVGFVEQQAASSAANEQALGRDLPRFHPATPPEQAANQPPNNVIDALGDNMPKAKRKAEMARWGQITKWALNIPQLALRNPRIVGLQRYVSFMRQMMNRKYETIVQAEETLKAWGKVGSKDQIKALGEFLFTMDKFGIDERRMPTEGPGGEFEAMVRKHKLTDETVEMYRRIAGDFTRILNVYEEILVNDALQIENEEAAAQAIAEVKEDFAKLRNRPYFPHQRFGRYTLVARNREGKVVYMEAFHTKFGRQRSRKEIRARYPQAQGFRLVEDILPDGVTPLMAMPVTLLNRMRDNDTIRFSDEQIDWMDRLVFEMAPAQGMRRNFLERDNVPGFSLDARRAYASYMHHAANHMARVEFAPKLKGSVSLVKQEARDIQAMGDELNVEKYRGIIRQLEDHMLSSMSPSTDWAMLRSVAFHWHLGAVPIAAAINLTQVPMVTLPYLQRVFGTVIPKKGLGRTLAILPDPVGQVRAQKAIAKAYRDFFGQITNLKPVDPALSADLQRATRMQIIDESMATELAGLSDGILIQRLMSGTPIQKGVQYASWLSAWMFQNAEKVNRNVTFRAARELALKHPETEGLRELEARQPEEMRILQEAGLDAVQARAFLMGVEAVQRTQFEYVREARPRIFKGALQSTLLTFYMYPQQMLFFMRHTPGGAQQLMMLLAMAGVMGLPAFEDISKLVKWASRILGVDFNPELEARKFIKELDVNPDLILHGLSSDSFGLRHVAELAGVTGFPDVDMSRNFSMGSLSPIDPEAFMADSTRELVGETVVSGSGAVFSIGFNLLNLMTEDNPDKWKAAEKAMPRALRNVSKAYRFAERGREETRGGLAAGTVAEFDTSDPKHMWEILVQGIGATPGRISEDWTRRRAEREVTHYWNSRRLKLTRALSFALAHGDREGKAEVFRRINAYNNEVRKVDHTFVINQRTLTRSIMEQLRRKAREEAGLPPSNQGAGIKRQMDLLFDSGEGEITADEPAR